jgi:hypothetical protein
MWRDAPQPLVARLIEIDIFNLGTIVLLYTSALSLGARRALGSRTVARTSFKSTCGRSIPICHQQEFRGEEEPSRLLCLASTESNIRHICEEGRRHAYSGRFVDAG